MPVHPSILAARGVRNPRDARNLMATLAAPQSPRNVVIRRKAAFGDVLMATPLAKRFADFGHTVHFETSCDSILSGLPFLKAVAVPAVSHSHVNLDNTYERNLNMKFHSVGRMFFEAAAVELRRRGIPEQPVNLRPHVALSKHELMSAAQRMSSMPRPWTVVCSRSFAWKTRTLETAQTNWILSAIPGGKFIAELDGIMPSPTVMVTSWTKTFREFAAVIANADLVVTVDTGPMHVAAALGKPIVAIEQSISIGLRLNNQCDYTVVRPELECSPCNEFKCILPEFNGTPRCQHVNGNAIASAAIAKLDTLTNGLVSVIIPAYKESPRLQRCVDAVKHQAAEVLVSLDGAFPHRAIPKEVRPIYGTGLREGYGKTCQRAARQAVGEYLLFLNDDCYLDGKAVAAMKDVLKNNADVAVVGALLRYPDGKIQHGGMFRGTGGYGHIDHLKSAASIHVPTEMECVTFAAALVRRSAFFEVGGFDEEYDCYSEDVDLCMKLRRAGWRVIYQPDAKGIHEESLSTGPEKQKMLAASHAILRRKWGAYFRNNPLAALGRNFSETQ